MDILQKLQRDIEGLLESAPAGTRLAMFQYIPVQVMRPRVKEDGSVEDAVMITNAIESALAGFTEKNGKAGLTAIVMMPDLGVPKELERVRGPMVQINVTIRIVEEPLVNMGPTGTGIPAEQCGLDTMAALNGWNPGRMQHALRARERGAMVEVALKDKPGQVCWDVELYAQYHVLPSPAADAPVISTSGALPAVEVSLTAPDEEAQIFYTLDGSFPHAGNAAASLYEAPFQVEAAATVRAIAFLANHLPSDVSELDIA